MVKLMEERNSESLNKLMKAMTNTQFSDDQIDVIRRANNMFTKLSNENLNVIVDINNQGQVKLSIPVGNSGVTMIVSNTNRPVDIYGSNKLLINEENLRTITDILETVMSL